MAHTTTVAGQPARPTLSVPTSPLIVLHCFPTEKSSQTTPASASLASFAPAGSWGKSWDKNQEKVLHGSGGRAKRRPARQFGKCRFLPSSLSPASAPPPAGRRELVMLKILIIVGGLLLSFFVLRPICYHLLVKKDKIKKNRKPLITKHKRKKIFGRRVTIKKSAFNTAPHCKEKVAPMDDLSVTDI
ncbi:MAG: hypothetical protein JRI59_03825 [Deltaproteobacteria bacterium]|nr:hypothetical protein [Deltaproteobacteria bacterium]